MFRASNSDKGSPPHLTQQHQSPFSPFSMSASQLEESSMDESTAEMMRDFQSSNAPFRGRSIKEVEEQISSLQKENFSLKLRLYLIEERAGTRINLDKGSVTRENVELKIAVENLKAELEEKHALLCQAAKAMEFEEKEYKKELQKKDLWIQNLQQKMNMEDHALRDCSSVETADIFSDSYQQLQSRIDELETKLAAEQELTQQLREELEETSARHQQQQVLQKDEKIQQLAAQLESSSKLLNDYNTRLEELESELLERDRELSSKVQDLNGIESLLSAKATELSSLRQLLSETEELRELDAEKMQKHKQSIAQRNSRIMELEEQSERQKARISLLETRLETAQNEVKRKNERSPRPQAPTSDCDSFLVPSPSNVAKVSPKVASARALAPDPATRSPTDSLLDDCALLDHRELQKQVAVLKQSEQRACKIIQSLMKTENKHDKEISALKNELKSKEVELHRLKLVIARFDSARGATKQKKQLVNNLATNSAESKNANDDGNNEDEDLIAKYKELETALENQNEVLKETLKEKDAQMQMLQDKYDNLLQKCILNENRIIDLEFELVSSNDHGDSSSKDTGTEKPSSFWIEEISEKDKEIERLEGELRRRTCDLQGIVNNELWEKNREIEKLQKRYGNIIEAKDAEIGGLEKDICSKDLQLTILKDKISELGVHVNLPANLLNQGLSVNRSRTSPEDLETLQEQLSLMKDERKYYVKQMEELRVQLKNTPEKEHQNVQSELLEVREELLKCERARKETSEVCQLLNNRLEELTCFLDSLLKQKSVLGFLGSRQNNKLRQVVDQSLDLSRSLSMSFTLNPDQSLVQLSNISNLLNATNVSIGEFLAQGEEHTSVLSINPASATLTYQSHLKLTDKKVSSNCHDMEQEAIIQVLREQVENLKKEIEVRDVELGKTSLANPADSARKKLLFKSADNNQSESESWSEPDRSVSIARIGLMEESLKPQSTSNVTRRNRSSALSTESTEGLELSRSKSGSTKKSYSENRQTIIALHEQVCDLEALLKDKDSSIDVLKQQLGQERSKANETAKMHEELLARYEKAELDFKASEAARDELLVQISDLQGLVKELQKTRRVLEENMVQKDKSMQNSINELHQENERLVRSAQEVAEQNHLELAKVEEQLKAVRNEIKVAEEEHRQRAETSLKLYEARVQSVQTLAEEQQKTLAENLRKTRDENAEAREQLQQAEVKIKALETEQELLQNRLQEAAKDHHMKCEVLRAELDAANLHYSEAILDKTRVINDKSALETRVQELANREHHLLVQIEQQLDDLSHVQTKLVRVESDKSALEMRVSELEAHSAELHNKFVRLQANQSQIQLSSSAPTIAIRSDVATSPMKHCLAIQRSFSLNSAEELCEDTKGLCEDRGLLGRGQEAVREVDNRRNATSSPDLGIDSDHGRFSSLEASVNLPRPFLRSLEVTASMNNLLDADRANHSICPNERCCVKTKEIIDENSDLRKRLLRTRRALEETVTQLTMANQRKKQVEKTICKQIHKTSQVLRKAKANLDSGSESDANFKP